MKATPTIHYVFSGRFPSEKAHALYVSKVADSFQNNGYPFVVVASKRGTLNGTAESFFNSSYPLKVVYIPTLDVSIFHFPKKFVFFVNYICFTLGTFLYFCFKNKNKTVIFSNESLPALLLSLMGKKVVYEMHDYGENYHWFFALLYKKTQFILPQNQFKKEKLLREFTVDAQKIIVEPNGVALETFDVTLSKEEARTQLGLPLDTFIVVYTGHLFDWKGADTLAKAASFLPSNFTVYFVGGSPSDVERFKETYESTSTITCVGYRPHIEMPLWQKAADCLVLPNTALQNISKYYTSPMKLFEYMASGRPIIASDVPSIKEVVDETMVTFVEPDNAEALAAQIQNLQQSVDLFQEKTIAAHKKVGDHTWDKRAARLIALCRL